MSKLNTLNKELDRARDIYQSAIDAVAMEVSEISGIECQANDLAGDGLGIRMEDDETGSETHVSIESLIEIFYSVGTITREDLSKTSF